jgi:ABC-2 type transport system ATP-binding protein
MLELDAVSRSFDRRKVLNEISFTVGTGRLTGFVGSNGAGKTTTMRIVLGVLAADSGRVRWRGADVDRAARRRFGYMPEERGLYPKMRVKDQLIYFGRLYGLSSAGAAQQVDELLERLELTERAGDRLDALSLGLRQHAKRA